MAIGHFAPPGKELGKSSVQIGLTPIWTGGEAKSPLRVFAKYLKTGLTDFHEAL